MGEGKRLTRSKNRLNSSRGRNIRISARRLERSAGGGSSSGQHSLGNGNEEDRDLHFGGFFFLWV